MMKILVTKVNHVAGTFWDKVPSATFKLTLEIRLVTLYVPTINGPFGEESNQRGQKDTELRVTYGQQRINKGLR